MKICCKTPCFLDKAYLTSGKTIAFINKSVQTSEINAIFLNIKKILQVNSYNLLNTRY